MLPTALEEVQINGYLFNLKKGKTNTCPILNTRSMGLGTKVEIPKYLESIF